MVFIILKEGFNILCGLSYKPIPNLLLFPSFNQKRGETMYEVYDSDGVKYGKYKTMKIAYAEIIKLIDSTGFIFYYLRQVQREDDLMLDYGSHSHFYYLKKVE